MLNSYVSFSYSPPLGIVASAKGLANFFLEDLSTDRDDLLSTNDLEVSHTVKKFMSGYYSSKNYMLMAHPFFRRGMHEQHNFAPKFVDLFWNFQQEGVDKYVAIDEDRLRVDVDGPCYLEEDTWYGAPFDKDIVNIPSGVGKLRPPSDIKKSHVDFFFADAYCLDFKWSEKKQIKTFQALEIKTDAINLMHGGEKYFPARYIHAEFDVSQGNFRHFDGAVQLFSEEEYFQRRDSDFNVNAKTPTQIKAHSKKLFKLNGPISVDKWVELCCHFFTGNPLVFEYFSGDYPAYIVDALRKLRAHDRSAS